jgi:hypothetical protein
MATPRPPVQSQPCTFTNRLGRMILKSGENRDPVVEPLAGLPPAQDHWYWQCDRGPRHTASHERRDAQTPP